MAKAATKKAPTEQLPQPAEPKRFAASRDELLSLYRDVLMLQLDAQVPMVNEDLRTQLLGIANRSTPQQTLFKLAQIELARTRISANVKDQMVMDALAVNLRTKP